MSFRGEKKKKNKTLLLFCHNLAVSVFTLPFIISYGLIKLLATIEILARSQKDRNAPLCCAAKCSELAVLALKYYDCVVTC